MTVNVHGTEYAIKESNIVEDPNLETCDGYCDTSTKTIVVGTFKDSPGALGDLEAYRKKVIRHELTHAFLFESGLSCNSWAKDEEVVDWIALQFSKLLKAFEQCEAI